LAAGVAGLALCAVGALIDPAGFFEGYLVGFNFWLAIALGSMAIWMIHNLTGGRWGMVIRRWLEAASRTLPLMAVAFVPVALGVNYLYIWAAPPPLSAGSVPTAGKALERQLKATTTESENDELEELHKLLAKKAAYLNVPSFLVRAAIYFA